VAVPERAEPLEVGRGRILREGSSAVAVLSYGATAAASLAAAQCLDMAGVSITVADGRFAKPVDDELIRRLVREHALLFIVEEGAMGGFSTQVFHSLHRQGLELAKSSLVPLQLPDRFVHHGSQKEQAADAGIDAAAIAQAIMRRYQAPAGTQEWRPGGMGRVAAE
jgi:1-deoxy-D-xylulose-5-phosphate synthase